MIYLFVLQFGCAALTQSANDPFKDSACTRRNNRSDIKLSMMLSANAILLHAVLSHRVNWEGGGSLRGYIEKFKKDTPDFT